MDQAADIGTRGRRAQHGGRGPGLKLWVCAASVLALSACANREPVPESREEGYSLAAQMEQAKEVLPFLEGGAEPKKKLTMPYCYRTLARPDCYRQPIAAAAQRTRVDWYHETHATAETP